MAKHSGYVEGWLELWGKPWCLWCQLWKFHHQLAQTGRPTTALLIGLSHAAQPFLPSFYRYCFSSLPSWGVLRPFELRAVVLTSKQLLERTAQPWHGGCWVAQCFQLCWDTWASARLQGWNHAPKQRLFQVGVTGCILLVPCTGLFCLRVVS